jgi:transposase
MMKTGRTRRDFEGMEDRRRKGMRLLAEGVSQAEVARRCGVSRTSAMRWDRARKRQRGAAWKRRTLGRPRKVTEAHLRTLRAALEKGAQAHGFLNELWTLPRVAEVLDRHCGVRCHPAHVWKLLARMGWSCQRPTGHAAERDEQAIALWKRHTWPALKKRPGAKAEPSSLSTKAD